MGRMLGIAAVILVLIGLGVFVFPLPQPIIEIAPEAVFHLGGLSITNTILTGWVMVAVIALVTYLGTRKLSVIPSGFQNAFEAIMEGFFNIVRGVAGEKNGRRFFPFVFTLLLYIVLSNWAALTPIFNIFGRSESVLELALEDAEARPTEVVEPGAKIEGWIMKKQGLWTVPLFQKTKFIEIEIPEEVHDEATGAMRQSTLCDVPQVITAALATELNREIDTSAENVEHGECAPAGEVLHDDEMYGFIAPFLRGVNTDVNAPLSYALWSFIFVEFWGITALGLFGYGSKFLNVKRLLKGDIVNGIIDIFVGILEFVSELSRIISFTFRLFGNIFAGEVLLFMMSFLLPFVLVDVFYMLELFVGLIQGFVFAMLTLVFGVMAVTGHGDHDDEHGHDEARGQGTAVHGAAAH